MIDIKTRINNLFIFEFYINEFNEYKSSFMKKALVISGGGSKGAFAGGVAQYLMKNEGKNYDFFIGTSTGSLMVSHLALGMLDELKEIYTNVNQESIFSNNPFTIKNIGSTKVISINHLNTFWNFINGRKTFGESKNLRKLIKRNITKKTQNVVTCLRLCPWRVQSERYRTIPAYSFFYCLMDLKFNGMCLGRPKKTRPDF